MGCLHCVLVLFVVFSFAHVAAGCTGGTIDSERRQISIAIPTETPSTAPSLTAPSESLPTPMASPRSVDALSMAEAVGLSRAKPFPMGALASMPNWDIQVLEVLRGESAWEILRETSRFNDPAPNRLEYVLARVHVACTYTDDDEHTIGPRDVRLTGSWLARYNTASIVHPEPKLEAALRTGEAIEGWVAYLVGEDESDLMLVFDEWEDGDTSRVRYLALEQDASIHVDEALDEIEPTQEGLSRGDPLPEGKVAVTENWEVAVYDSLRGESAWKLVLEANPLNEPPAEGMEYLAFWARIRRIGTDESPARVDDNLFEATGSANVLYRSPAIVEPEPALEAMLYPGGGAAGWVVEQVAVGEEDAMVLFASVYEYSPGSDRFLALENGASVSADPSLVKIRVNGLGRKRENPAPFGETVITDDWEVTVLEVIRGEAAWDMIGEASQYSEPADKGMEYVLVKIRARNIDTTDTDAFISGALFQVVDSEEKPLDPPSVYDPEPPLSLRLFPGGQSEGWMTHLVREGEESLVLVFGPEWTFEENVRYLALE